MWDRVYSLALGGGAARWFVHIGAYRYIRERSIRIGELSGTSMGAIIAAFIALGKTPEEIAQYAKEISYYRLLDPDFSLGLIRGEKIEAELRRIFGRTRIEDLPVPLRITATNLDHGTLRIFSQGDLVDAIRASISIPGVFAPKTLEGINYVDGGIIMNLPVQALSGENVIAISALKNDFPEILKTKTVLGFTVRSGFFENNFEILNRSLNLLMKTNEDISLLTVGKNIHFVRPYFGALDSLDFDRLDELEDLGYRSAAAELDRIFDRPQ